MLRNIHIRFTMLLLLTFGICAYAAGGAQAMLESLSQQMLGELRKNQTTLKNNPQLVYGLVKRVLLPHVDVTTMARAVAGREAWAAADSATQRRFVQAFSHRVINTYSSALASYTNESIEFLPSRMNGSETIQVNSRIIRQSGPTIPVSYRLLQRDGQWFVYDLIVENISLVQSFRSQLAEPIRQGGLPQAISALGAR